MPKAYHPATTPTTTRGHCRGHGRHVRYSHDIIINIWRNLWINSHHVAFRNLIVIINITYNIVFGE